MRTFEMDKWKIQKIIRDTLSDFKGALSYILRSTGIVNLITPECIGELIEAPMDELHDLDVYAIQEESDFREQIFSGIIHNALFCQMFSEYELFMQHVLKGFKKENEKNNDKHNKKLKDKYNDELNDEPVVTRRIWIKYEEFVKDKLRIKNYGNRDGTDEKDVRAMIIEYRDVRNHISHMAAYYDAFDYKQNDKDKKKYDKVKKSVILGKEFVIGDVFEFNPINRFGEGEIVFKNDRYYVKYPLAFQNIEKLMIEDAERVCELLEKHYKIPR